MITEKNDILPSGNDGLRKASTSPIKIPGTAMIGAWFHIQFCNLKHVEMEKLSRKIR